MANPSLMTYFARGHSPEEKFADDICTLHGQVCNGGFDQWESNGYGTRAKVEEIIQHLRPINTPAVTEVRGLLRGCLDAFSRSSNPDRMADALGELDDPYYAVSDQFMADCSAHFASTMLVGAFRELGEKIADGKSAIAGLEAADILRPETIPGTVPALNEGVALGEAATICNAAAERVRESLAIKSLRSFAEDERLRTGILVKAEPSVFAAAAPGAEAARPTM